MTRLTSLARFMLPKEVQTLIKGGLLNGDLSVTERGQAGINALIVEKHLDELVKLAEARIAEDKEKE